MCVVMQTVASLKQVVAAVVFVAAVAALVVVIKGQHLCMLSMS